MTIVELFKKFDFHDSSIGEIIYFPNERKLEMKIELCNWKQNYYNEQDNEIVDGSIIFHDVGNYRITPDVLIKDNEILKMELLNNGQTQEIKIVLNAEPDVILLNIQANEVTVNFGE